MSSPFAAQNYTQMAWAKKPFEETKASCRDASVRSGGWGVNDVNPTRFKTCMDKKGWRYRGDAFY